MAMGNGELSVNGEGEVVIPAYRLGVQETGKLRAAADLKRSSTTEAAPVHTPINLPPRCHLAQLRDSHRFRRETRPFFRAKGDHADAHRQLPLAGEDQLAAAVTLRNPGDQPKYGFVPGLGSLVLRQPCFITAVPRAR